MSAWTMVDASRLSLRNSLTSFHKDPEAQLQKLARQQSEELLEMLGDTGRDSNDLSSRSLPRSSEELLSPTYAVRSAPVLSPRPVKGRVSSSSLLSLMADLEVTPRSSPLPTGEHLFNPPASTSEEPILNSDYYAHQPESAS